jgi:hypothetical protein
MGGFCAENRMIEFGWVRFRPEMRPLHAAANQHSLTHDRRKGPPMKVVLAPLGGRLEHRWEADG